MPPSHAARRRCLAVAAASVLLAANRTAASISSPPPSVGALTQASMEGRVGKRRRRRKHSSGQSSAEVCVDDNDLQRKAVLAESEGDRPQSIICKSLASTVTDGDDEGATKRRKRKRRRKAGDSGAAGLQQNHEDVLLPIDDGTISEDDGESFASGDSAHDVHQSTQMHSEESIGRTKEMEDSSDASSPSITVLRNETTESMAISEEAGVEYTKQYEEETMEVNGDNSDVEYTKRSEEETIEILDADADGGAMVSVQSTQQYENMQISGGGAGQSVTVRMTRQKKQQSVHITSPGSARKKSSLTKPKKATSTAVTSRGSGKGGECLRRIKREWKDAVKMGIAYDWINSKSIREVAHANNNYVRIGPFGKNLLRWHFSVAGPANSAYEEGIYHGRVLLPKDYPGSPPRVQMLTPSGRFICGADICLSASSYHPETWTPRWTVLSLVDALRLHMLTTANEIGGVTATDERRREYAKESRDWRSPGMADHARMVADGLFPLVTEEKLEDGAEGNDEPIDPVIGKDPRGASEKVDVHQNTPSDGVAVEKENIAPPTETRAKSTKAEKRQRSSDRKTRQVEKTASTSRNRQSPSSEKDRSILSILLRKIVIEMLKLPLRMISILLTILRGLEKCLRAITDAL
ncbi:hypothetical protein ACHAXT_008606 [Thalassiosira profunda]